MSNHLDLDQDRYSVSPDHDMGPNIGPVTQKQNCVELRLFSYPSVSTCVLGVQKKRLIETDL